MDHGAGPDGSSWDVSYGTAIPGSGAPRGTDRRGDIGYAYRPSEVRLPRSSVRPRADAATQRRIRPGTVLVRLFRDVDFGGPTLEVTEGREEPDGDVIVDLDGYWRHNLSAIRPGDVGIVFADLSHHDPRMPVIRVHLPMSRLPDKWWDYNDRIGRIRLLARPR